MRGRDATGAAMIDHNKGESLHALRRDLHYAQQSAISKPLLADQTEQAWCLTVLTNAVITWTTEYYQIAVQDLRAKGPGRARAEHELDVARAELVPLRREPEPTQTPASGRSRRSG